MHAVLCGTGASTTCVKKDFSLALNCDGFGVCDCYMIRGHTAQQHAPTGCIYISQLEQAKLRLLTHATSFLGHRSPGAQHDCLAFRPCKSTFRVTQQQFLHSQKNESRKVVSSYHFTPCALFTSWSL